MNILTNIHLKIEAKNAVRKNLPDFDLKDIYTALNKDFFLLPYKVKKLSKRAKRNNC